MLTLGTFNTLDGKGTVVPFADIILITEGVPKKVRRELKATHHVYVCGFQRDLIIAIRKTLDPTRVVKHYRPVHGGRRKVTPHRGEFWLTLRLAGDDSAVQVGHWINAGFPPFRRGEGEFRQSMWRKHQRIALRIIARHVRRGRTVYAGGDANAIPSVRAYDGVLHEVGDHFDRLASTRPLRDLETLSRMGSDHPRLRARVS